MKTNPPLLMLAIVAGAIGIFVIGALIALTQAQPNSATVAEETRTLSDVVRQNEPLASAAVTYPPCIVPTAAPQTAATIEQAAEADSTAPTQQLVATVALPPSLVLISDETFVELQASNTIITNDNPGYLGVVVQDVLNCGTQVMDFREDGPAVESELEVGDVIVAVNGIALSSLTGQAAGNYLDATPSLAASVQGVAAFTPARVLFNQLHQLVPQVTITLTVQRSGEHLDIRVPLTDWPAS